ncbi:hypothetical protein J6590_058779 [Homalodisca vitripennis]|nr:hypothetical protein J6590_058779 [Homalodisca vitripennis]
MSVAVERGEELERERVTKVTKEEQRENLASDDTYCNITATAILFTKSVSQTKLSKLLNRVEEKEWETEQQACLIGAKSGARIGATIGS